MTNPSHQFRSGNVRPLANVIRRWSSRAQNGQRFTSFEIPLVKKRLKGCLELDTFPSGILESALEKSLEKRILIGYKEDQRPSSPARPHHQIIYFVIVI